MNEPKRQSPFITLGKHLKFLREHKKISLAEVSGAIEIDPDMLERIEEGLERPDEDTLMLLINYFGLQDQEAIQIWQSAGYVRDDDYVLNSIKDSPTKVATILLALDTRIMYSDAASLVGSDNGLVMNFMQKVGQEQPVTISRIGMSYDQAEDILNILEKMILRHKYLPNLRMLPPGQSI